MEAIAMNTKQFPVIDPIATGKNIIRLRVERGMSAVSYTHLYCGEKDDL